MSAVRGALSDGGFGEESLTFFDPSDPSGSSIETVWKAVDKAEKQSHPRNPAPDTDTKDGIMNAMLNSIDHYDKASGRIIIGDRIESGRCCYDIVDFDTDLDTGRSYCYLNTFSSEYTDISDFESTAEENSFGYDLLTNARISCTDGNMGYDLDLVNGNLTVQSCLNRINSGEYKTWQECIITDPNGIKSYSYRCKITNTPYADRCLAPFELAFTLLEKSDNWNIEYEEIYKGRKCAVIKGICERNDWSSFELYTDKINGTLLKFKIYNADGELLRFMRTDDISFDDAVEDIRNIDISEFSDDFGDPEAEKPGFIRLLTPEDGNLNSGESYIRFKDIAKLDPEGGNVIDVYEKDCETVKGNITI